MTSDGETWNEELAELLAVRGFVSRPTHRIVSHRPTRPPGDFLPRLLPPSLLYRDGPQYSTTFRIPGPDGDGWDLALFVTSEATSSCPIDSLFSLSARKLWSFVDSVVVWWADFTLSANWLSISGTQAWSCSPSTVWLKTGFALTSLWWPSDNVLHLCLGTPPGIPFITDTNEWWDILWAQPSSLFTV